MKRRIPSFLMMLVLVISSFVIFPQTAYAASAPTSFWIEFSADNNIPARIDVRDIWPDGTGTSGVYQIFLPGNAVQSKCFLSWDGDATVTVGGITYASGELPIPTVNTYTQTTYTFKYGTQTTSFKFIAYQGSESVQVVFIDIDENYVAEGETEPHTIQKMDEDTDHEAYCVGTICINGEWMEMPKIKGRGNATWTGAEDKKPYNITLGSKINFPGVNSDKTKKWSFLAEITDHSLMSNRAGYHLAYKLGIGQDTTSADVWMNGEYQGCYTVTPKTDSFVTKAGFMIEQDNYLEPSVSSGGDPQFQLMGMKEVGASWGGGSGYNRITVKKMGDTLLGAGGEDPDNMENIAYNTIQPWLQDAWDAIRSDSGYKGDKYYTDYIDIESFAKMYLMHEYAKSFDVCAGSILFHRDGMTDEYKLIAGPMWDLDNAMGSTCQNSSLGVADSRKSGEGDRRSGEGSFIPNVTEYKTSIYKTISKHDDFMEEVYRQYNKYKAEFDALPGVVEQMTNEIADSARMNHYKVKDITGTYKNTHKYGRYDTHTFGSGQYYQEYLTTTNSKTDWPNYAANLLTYVQTRTKWFQNTYYDENYVCEHEYEPVVTPPTCTAGGYTTYTCIFCGDSYTGDPTQKIAHDYQNGACTVCGEILLNVTIECDEGASVTVYETQDLNGTCIENAEIVHPRDSATGLIDCSGSGQVNFVVHVEPGYTLTSVAAEPATSYKNLKGEADTGVVNGYRATKVTGDFTINVSTVVCSHEYTTTVTEPTCTIKGSTTYTCSLCGYTYSEPIPKLAHDYQDGVCTVCGEVLLNVTIVCGEGASVTVYETQDLNGTCIENAEIVHPRDSATGLIDCSGNGQVNFVVNVEPGYTLTSVTAEPATSYKNLKGEADTGVVNGYRATKVTGDFTINITTEITQPASAAKFQNVAASFDGKINLNFYISIPDDILESIYAVITVNDRTERIHASDAEFDSDKNGYRFSVDLYAKEIKDTVNIKLVDSNDVPVTFTNSSETMDFTETGADYTVEQYVDYMIANGSTDSMKALARAAKDYCYAASNNFSGTALELSSAVGEVTAQDLEGYKAIREGELPNGVSIKGISALFESDNSFRFYLGFSGVDPMAFTYAIDGVPAELQTTTDGQYYLTVTNVAASKLHVAHTYTVSDGATTFTMTASVLSYARSGITQGTTEAAKMLSKALYLYNRAAYAYFGDN